MPSMHVDNRSRSAPRRNRRRGDDGSATLYVIVLSPVLMLGLALVAITASLQLEKARLRSAVDEATVAAANQGADAGPQAGIDPVRAASALRTLLADNLDGLRSHLAGTTPNEIAAAAEIAVVTTVPARDPFGTGMVVRPTVEVRVRIPVDSSLLPMVGLPRVVTFTLVSSADVRMTGDGNA